MGSGANRLKARPPTAKRRSSLERSAGKRPFPAKLMQESAVEEHLFLPPPIRHLTL